MSHQLVKLSNNLLVNVLHYEYVGYGLANQYQPSESGTYFLIFIATHPIHNISTFSSFKDTYESAEAAYEYLTKAQKVNPKDIGKFFEIFCSTNILKI